jgi:hypothetical protein
MKPAIFCENNLGTRGICIVWERNRGLIEINRYSEDYDSFELEIMSLNEFLTRIGITEEDAQNAFGTKIK